MPIYEYQCPKCGTFELMQRITDAPLRKCPTCKGKVERLVSRTSFVLKGSGWYATDYAKSSKPESEAAKPESAASDSGSSSSTAAKSDSGSSDTGKSSSSETTKSSSETTKSSGSEKSAAK